jgi:hypothetical protein
MFIITSSAIDDYLVDFLIAVWVDDVGGTFTY